MAFSYNGMKTSFCTHWVLYKYCVFVTILSRGSRQAFYCVLQPLQQHLHECMHSEHNMCTSLQWTTYSTFSRAGLTYIHVQRTKAHSQELQRGIIPEQQWSWMNSIKNPSERNYCMPAYIIEVVQLSYSTKLSSLICGTSIGNNLVHQQSSINNNSWLHLQIIAGTDEDNHQKCTSYTFAFIHAFLCIYIDIKLRRMHNILRRAYITEHCKCRSRGGNKQESDCNQGRQHTQCLAATLAPWIQEQFAPYCHPPSHLQPSPLKLWWGIRWLKELQISCGAHDGWYWLRGTGGRE